MPETDADTDDKPPQPSFWAFTSADWKNLVVGLIGSLVTVVIVAVALIVNRHLGSIRLSAVTYLEIVGGFAAVGILSFATKKVEALSRALLLLFFGAFALGVVFALFLVLGEAAGVK
jgi:hypothetical protein